MLTPRAKKRQVLAAAYAQAKAVSCNTDMAAKVFDEFLTKEGWRVTRIPNYELRQQAAEDGAALQAAPPHHHNGGRR